MLHPVHRFLEPHRQEVRRRAIGGRSEERAGGLETSDRKVQRPHQRACHEKLATRGWSPARIRRPFFFVADEYCQHSENIERAVHDKGYEDTLFRTRHASTRRCDSPATRSVTYDWTAFGTWVNIVYVRNILLPFNSKLIVSCGSAVQVAGHFSSSVLYNYCSGVGNLMQALTFFTVTGIINIFNLTETNTRFAKERKAGKCNKGGTVT